MGIRIGTTPIGDWRRGGTTSKVMLGGVQVWPGVEQPTERPWTPADLATVAWHDAADALTITLGSGRVSEWRDKSGNSNHLSSTLSQSQPTFLTTGFNGKSTVFFDRTTDELLWANTIPQGVGQDIFVVADTTLLVAGGTPGWNLLMDRTNAAVDNPALYFGGPMNPNSEEGPPYCPAVYWGGVRAAQPTVVQRKVLMRFSIWTGGALTQVDAGTPVNEYFGSGETTAWSGVNNQPVQRSRFKLSELIITPGQPDTSDLNRIEGYLAHKWGLTSLLPANHPYKSAPPTT